MNTRRTLFLSAAAGFFTARNLFGQTTRFALDRSGPKYVEPRTFNLEGLNRCFADAWAQDAIPYLPDAVYTLSDTLVLKNKSGKRIQTSGRTRFSPRPLDGNRSLNGGPILVYEGDPAKPCILIDSSLQLRFDALTLKGKSNIGFQFVNAGYGNAGHVFQSVQVLNCSEGYSFGVPSEDQGTNSDVAFHDCSFLDCGSGIVTHGHQQLNYYAYNLNAMRCGSVFTARKGGSFRVCGGSTYECDWLFSQGEGGENVGPSIASGVRTDGGGLTRRQGGWLRTLPGGSFMSTYVLTGLADVGTDKAKMHENEYLIDVTGGVNVLLQGCTTRTNLARLTPRAQVPSVAADACRLTSGKAGPVVLRNCVDWTGNPLTA
jgi:hypothetical protein